MWAGLLHHVTGEHEWALGACHHGPLSDNRDKEWIEKGSVAHRALIEIVLNARWLGEVVKYLGFRYVGMGFTCNVYVHKYLTQTKEAPGLLPINPHREEKSE